MCFLVLLNTISCQYRIFENKNDANNFGLALKYFGEGQGLNFRYKIICTKPKFIENRRYNGYELKMINDSLFLEILRGLRDGEF